jgi:hypothetical protein
VAGNSNISGTSRIGGTTTIIGSLSSGSHTVAGNSRITNRIDTNTIYADTYLNLPVIDIDTKEDIVNHIYPVGSIFLSFTNADPSFRFTGTLWVQVSQGRFVVGVGTGNDEIQNRVFTAGNTTGEYNHTLTVAEMPNHTHSLDVDGEQFYITNDANTSGPNTFGRFRAQGPSDDNDGRYCPQLPSTGGGQAHNNTPPGFGLYVWQRTS